MQSAPLKVVSSERHGDPDELVTFATGAVPAAAHRRFAAAGNHSMMVRTKSAVADTGIRIGNTGAQLGPAAAHRELWPGNR